MKSYTIHMEEMDDGHQYKSMRGPRNTKITLAVPQSLYSELKDIAVVTGRPTNDVINAFLETYALDNREIMLKYRKLINKLQEE